MHKMRMICGFLSVAALALGTFEAASAQSVLLDPQSGVVVEAPAVALVGVRVIDGTGRPPVDDQTIVIVEGRIDVIGPADSVVIPAGAETLDLSGRSVLPGLVMLHEHLMYSVDDVVWHAQPVSYPPLYLAAGVTTIRTAGTEFPFTELTLKSWIDEGRIAGPKLHLTAPFFNGPEGDFLGEIRLRSPEEARRAVDYWADLGFTSFKVYTDITAELLAAVSEAAHARGLTVAGHLRSVSCREAAALDIDTIEHAFGSCLVDLGRDWTRVGSGITASAPVVQDLIRHLVEMDVVLVATPYERYTSDEVLDLLHPHAREAYLRFLAQRSGTGDDGGAHRALERAFVAAGGRLGVGSDPCCNGVVPGYSNHSALNLLVEAGWEPLEVLRLATSNNAEILGVGDSVGRIAEGLAADVMVVPGDPSSDIRHLSMVELVFKDGVGYSPRKLRASVRGKVGWH